METKSLFFFPTGKEKIKSSYSSVIQENERKCLEMKNNQNLKDFAVIVDSNLQIRLLCNAVVSPIKTYV